MGSIGSCLILFLCVFVNLTYSNPKGNCPKGVKRHNCFVNPCDTATCPKHTDAHCKPNYCGGCNFYFHHAGRKVNCGNEEAFLKLSFGGAADMDESDTMEKIGDGFCRPTPDPGSIYHRGVNSKEECNEKCLSVDSCGSAEYSKDGCFTYPSKEGQEVHVSRYSSIKAFCYKKKKATHHDHDEFIPQPNSDGHQGIGIPLGSAETDDNSPPPVDGHSTGGLPDFGGNGGYSGGYPDNGGFTWPDFQPAKPELSETEFVTVSGEVRFPKALGQLPAGSCLSVAFQDQSLMDVASSTIKQEIYKLGGKDVGKKVQYSLTFGKPLSYQSPFFALQSVLNIGWCPKENDDEWLREGDYFHDDTIAVSLKKTKTNYKKNITLMKHGH